MTTHDQFAISFSANEAVGKVKSLLSTQTEGEARKIFKLCSQSQWSYDRAKEELPKVNIASAAQRVTYRPFDDQWTIWDKNVTVHRRDRAMKHMQLGSIGLVFVRQVSHANQDRSVYALATDAPIDNRAFVSAKGIAFVEPLYLDGTTENLTPAFRDFIDDRYGQHYDPEQILGYIYAVLHAPTYRTRYAEFLRIDFPRIPFAETAEQFEALSTLGWALIQTHLLKTVPRSKPRLGDYVGKGDHTVEAVRYSPEEQTVWINRTQGFANLPQAVWDFHIGGYQVIDKYLKSRKGRVLNLDEQTHVGNIAESLSFTIAQMAKIDAEYLEAFPEQS